METRSNLNVGNGYLVSSFFFILFVNLRVLKIVLHDSS